MRVNRRQFLESSTAFGTALLLPLSGRANARSQLIRAGFAKAPLMGAGKPETSVLAYDAQVPGPTIRIPKGKRVTLRVLNDLDQPTSVHWHGIRLENGMDGVPGLTQDPIQPGATFEYSFIAPDAGTFWYHSHLRSWEQVGRGLYGPLIVEEPSPVPVDSDRVFLVDDWRLDDAGQITDDFGHMRDASHGGRMGNWLTVNGQTRPRFDVRPGERVRLRCISAANARVMAFAFSGLDVRMIAIDGQPLSEPQKLEDPLLLAPAQRADLIFDVPRNGVTTLSIDEVSTGEPLSAAVLAVSGTPQDVPEVPVSSIVLPPNPLPADLMINDALAVDLLMEGGAMGRLRKAYYKGQMYDLRTLAMEKGKVWTFNGEAGTTIDPLFKSPLGAPVTVNMVNETRWPHAMHIHGHHFKVVEKNDQVVSGSAWRDTELILPGDRIRIAFVADNPGKWLFHCHMLEHHFAGMGTWFEVGASS